MSSPALLSPAQRAAAEAGLAYAEQAMARHMEAVGTRYGPAALGVIDLPPLTGGRLVDAQIRVSGVLYWAAELEAAGLLPFVEALAEGVATGAVMEPLGAAVHELIRFWRSREHRFTGAERLALFGRVLGGAASTGEAVEPLLATLVETLVALGRSRADVGTGALEARAAVQAQALGSVLSSRGVGIAGFAARDVVGQVRAALGVLRNGDVVRAMGGGSPWTIVTRHAPRFLRRMVDAQPHLERAQAGMRIVGWIADEAPRLDAGAVRIARGAQVVHDAEAWSAAAGAA
ncbi:hypothetical protein [Longimicrobium sp.]|uniref:hypothetical protein n=1 Tax=Longimicrobium sp. TaxID=2029185 RepID=UPI002B7B1922|nr:hypothetical protein [Longimicrobium sp.]HSU14308.1 hypothetical protein [Longimicrobium sp.]